MRNFLCAHRIGPIVRIRGELSEARARSHGSEVQGSDHGVLAAAAGMIVVVTVTVALLLLLVFQEVMKTSRVTTRRSAYVTRT